MMHGRRWERSILIAIASIVAYQVFCAPIVGTADNSDYWRVTDQIGIGYHGDAAATRFKSIRLEWERIEPTPVAYLTSEVLLGDLAVAIDRIVSKDGLFDLRVMGAVHAAAYLAAIAVFLAAFRGRRRRVRIAVGIAALLIFTDVRLVAYFNSFYCEPAQLIFGIATIGFSLLAADTTRTQRQRELLFAAFLISTVLFAFAKTQDLVFCFPLAAIAYRICPAPTRWSRLAIAAAIVAMFGWGMASDAYAATKGINARVALGEEILPHSRTKDADLAELGGGPDQVTLGRIAAFYAHHPYRWWKLAKRRMHEAFTRTPYGNFEPPVVAESHTFDGFSSWKTAHYPRSLWFWLAAMAGYAALLAARWRTGDPAARTSALCNAMWVVGCVLQFIAVVTFEANGTEKHFFIFNVLVDLVIAMSFVEIDAAITAWRARRRR